MYGHAFIPVSLSTRSSSPCLFPRPGRKARTKTKWHEHTHTILAPSRELPGVPFTLHSHVVLARTQIERTPSVAQIEQRFVCLDKLELTNNSHKITRFLCPPPRPNVKPSKPLAFDRNEFHALLVTHVYSQRAGSLARQGPRRIDSATRSSALGGPCTPQSRRTWTRRDM